MVSDRSVAASILLMLTCLLLGLLTGAMLVIGVSLVSFWKSLSPGDFQVWFASHSNPIGRLMLPLGIGGLAVSVAAAIAGWRSSARGWVLIAAVSAMGVMVTYPLFFATTNETFVRGGLADAAARSLLDRWAAWHWLRTGLGAVGFVAALRALHG
jgi:Anthrone oxygenase